MLVAKKKGQTVKDKIKVLITPTGTQTAVEIIKALRDYPEIELFGCDTDSLNVGFRMIKPSHTLLTSHFIYDPKFFSLLEKYVEEKGIDLVYPTHDWFIIPFAERGRIGRARFMVPPVETASVIISKESIYNYLGETIRVPQIYSPDKISPSDYPVFVKPKKGRGSEQANKVNNEEEKTLFLNIIDEPLFLEYLPGTEYTVDCVGDMNGKLRVTVIRERIKILRGISVIARVVENNKIVDIAERITSELVLPGAWFFQIREDRKGRPTLLEINARIGGTTCLSRVAGVNLPYLSVLLFMGQKLDYIPPPLSGVCVTRYITEEYLFSPERKFKCVIWDMDDTLWYGRYEENAMPPKEGVESILVELKQKGIIQCLVSRNPYLTNAKEKEITTLLKQNGIPEVFSCIEINDIPKSEIIRKIANNFNLHLKEIIFIDDAFSERGEVRRNASGVFVLDAASYKDVLNIIGQSNGFIVNKIA